MLKSQTYPVSNLVITKDIFSLYINNFWNEVYSIIFKSGQPKYLMLLVKVYFSDGSLGYKTIGKVRAVDFNDKGLFLEYLVARLGILEDSYSVNPISKIVFSYMVRDGQVSDNDRRLLQDLPVKVTNTHRFSNLNLAITMDPAEYGSIRAVTAFDNFIRYIVDSVNNKRHYEIDVSKDGTTNNVSIKGGSDLKWTDTFKNGGFERVIGKSTYLFVDGELVLRKVILASKGFRKLNPDKQIISKFLTFDIETVKDVTGSLLPYCICASNNVTSIHSYAKDPVQLFNNFIEALTKTFKGKVQYIYAHNLSSFDGIFALRHLWNLGIVEPLIHNGKVISIKLRLNNGKTFIFKDSYLLLPIALRALCFAFGLTTPKGYFPFKLMNIFYTGVYPKFSYWTGITLEQWSELKLGFGKHLWSFQDESLKYCIQDCVALHQVLTKFNELVFDKFQVNIHSVLTLPALAMKIYKIKFIICLKIVYSKYQVKLKKQLDNPT